MRGSIRKIIVTFVPQFINHHLKIKIICIQKH
jgi:hypothetical protein